MAGSVSEVAFTGAQYDIVAGEFSATVTEVGAALRALRRGDVDLTCTYPDGSLPPKACGITLAPWPNRIRDGRYTFDGVEQQLPITEPAHGNAIHGLGRWTRWQPVEQAADRITLRMDVVPQNGYPFEVSVEVTYAVHGRSGLTVTTRAVNHGTVRAPFGAGHHPYLATHGHGLADVTVTLDAATTLDVDDRQIPVGRHDVTGTDHDLRDGVLLTTVRYDAGFADIARGADGLAAGTVMTPSGGARLWFDAAYPYAQVFTVDDLLPGLAGVAIEPMSCPADAFTSGEALIVLEPGAEWAGTWGINDVRVSS